MSWRNEQTLAVLLHSRKIIKFHNLTVYSLTAQSLPLCVAPIKSTKESLAKSGDRFSRLSIGALAGIITSVCVAGVVLIGAISVVVRIQSLSVDIDFNYTSS